MFFEVFLHSVVDKSVMSEAIAEQVVRKLQAEKHQIQGLADIHNTSMQKCHLCMHSCAFYLYL